MCTVTVIPTPLGPRLVHSRDEQRSRAAAGSLESRVLRSKRRVEWPVDPDSGGTWIGLRDDGFALAILNRNIPPNGRPAPTRSRGLVIPALIDFDDGLGVMQALGSYGLGETAPFRLLALDPEGQTRVATWNGLELALDEPSEAGVPVCLVSSGLGDDRVEPRLTLFDELVRPDPTPQSQDRFHRHRWDDRPEISVLMSRPDARTVSMTVVEHAGALRIATLSEADPATDPVGAQLARR